MSDLELDSLHSLMHIFDGQNVRNVGMTNLTRVSGMKAGQRMKYAFLLIPPWILSLTRPTRILCSSLPSKGTDVCGLRSFLSTSQGALDWMLKTGQCYVRSRGSFITHNCL